MHSNKLIGKIEAAEEQPIRDFKKNRNMSTNSAHTNSGHSTSPSINININQNMGFVPNQTIVSSPTLAQMNNNPPSNILSPNAKPVYSEQKASSSYGKEGRVSDEHKLVLEGVRLAMEIIEAKLPNHMGYAHLLLTRTLSVLGELSTKCGKK